ncbi:hypothetical protein [Actinacidiphila oryziradicis]|jgi:hypothetical protein|uniref:Uncharacterized protein n=1 Tax=Actinacidiphila oryziradicis TaxID=2571141 RepID=A0A4U0SM89_9ACTN|nr:hypothetical protein [Actinacidiphila oryziradicis]MCW2871927.1 hypothetical protein [Actinacidiphila oryziradicis]TKA10178.1 hypothetical protein FCI23_18415 [Actinacidiphila oryziradicis]
MSTYLSTATHAVAVRARQAGRMNEIMNEGWNPAGRSRGTERALAAGLAVAGVAGVLWLVAMVYVIAAWALSG